ncbi:MAG: hypothetical protein LBB48_00905 [Treponema sp.]|jgi:hypothetical protein|nr:hypothetical protein [Treponema sp.]
MKKLGILLGMAAVLFLACNINWSDLAAPEQAKVETTPGFYLPLTGNLFSGEFEKYSPEKLINDSLSPDKVRGMLGGGGMAGITVATYDDPAHPGTLTYLLRYPLAEMPLDLSQYMASLDVKVPPIETLVPPPGPLSPKNLSPGDPCEPPYTIPQINVDIHDMANLLVSLTYTKFGIKIKGDFRTAEVEITDSSGLNLTPQGVFDGAYTYFVDSPIPPSTATWSPSKDHPTLAITMTLKTYPDGVSNVGRLTIAPEFVLDWTEAKVKVNPENIGNLEGSISLDLTTLDGTLKNIEFDSVEGYLYTTSGLPPASNAMVTLTSSAGGASLPSDRPLNEAAAPAFPADGSDYKGPLPPSSLDNPIVLTDTLNASLSGEVKLGYKVKIGTLLLEKEKIDRGAIISAVLLIKLPLAFIYSGASVSIEGDRYIKFAMEGVDLSAMFDADEDLLEPIKGEFNSGGVSGQLELTKVSLVLAGCDVSLLDGVYIAIRQHNGVPDGDRTLIDFSSSSPGDNIRVELDMDMTQRFAPAIDILLKEDRPGKAKLSLKKGGRFRFGLITELESALDATVTL